MSLWDRALAPIRALVRRRDDPIRYYHWINLDAPSGIVITPESALQISVVWGCVMALTNAVGPSRWNVFTTKGQSLEWLPDDPLDYVLNVRPNPDMTAIGFREALMIAALTWGNGYAEIVKNGRGQPSALWPMLPDRTIPRRRTVKPYALYYEYHQQDGSVVELESEDVFHLKGPGISGLMGDNLVARAAKSIGLAAAQERFASTFFGNNTLVGGWLKSPKTLQPDAHKRLKEDWEDKNKGPFKSNRPVILEAGMEWVPNVIDADKAQALESRQFSIEDICRWYNVPPHKVQHLLRSTFNNIEHLGIEFTRDGVTPWAVRLQQEADYKFFSDRGPKRLTKLDTGWLSHGDAKSRSDAHKTWNSMGVYTVNEIRAMEGKNGIGPDGDVRLVPLNMTTLEAMANTPADALAKKPPSAGGDGSTDGEGDATTDPGEKNADGGGTDAGANKDGAGGTDSQNAVRESLHLVFCSALDRYQRRLQNRETDLRRHTQHEPKIAAKLAQEREKQRPRLLDDCRQAMKIAPSHFAGIERLDLDAEMLIAADLVDGGMSPEAAATGLLERFAGMETK